jgi:hypothetical protein
MERVIVNEGTKVNLYDLFEDLQDYSQTNFLRVIDLLIETYGVNADYLQSGIPASDTTLKVTTSAGTYVNIAPGEALTSGLHYIRISAPTTFSTVGLSVGDHKLWLMHQYSESDPVDVMSGFAIGLLGGSQRNSRKHDSYAFAWDMVTTTSGVLLANVAIIGGALVDEVEDERHANILKFKTNVIPVDVVRKTETAVQEVQGGFWAASLAAVGVSYLDKFTITTGTGIHTLSGNEATLLKARSHDQNTDTYTTASNFYVGGPAGTGSLVLTIPDEPMLPQNLRIVDISPVTLSDYRDKAYEESRMPLEVKVGLISHEAAVTMKWNWDEVLMIGAPGPNTALIALNPGPDREVLADELIGYHFWHPTGYDYVITDNGASYSVTGQYATQITVQPYGHSVGLETLPLIYTGTSAKAWVHSNADSYDIVAIPVTKSDDEVLEERYEARIISANGTPISLKTMENYFLGENIRINIRANNLSRHSGWAIMPPGSFTKPSPWLSPVTYRSPLLVKIPDISSVGASISAAGSSTGFVININGWSLATDFELVWSADQNGADFNNPRAERRITSARKVDITTSMTIRYYVKVRPLISGQSVAPALATDVMSGSGGQKPVIYTFGPTQVNLKTYSGTIGGYNVGPEAWSLTSMYSPAGSVVVSGYINSSLQGETLTVGVTDYNIDDTMGSYFLCLSDMNGNFVSAGLAGQAYTIGVSKFARELHTWTGPGFDFVITEIEVNQFAKPGSNVYATSPVLRVYPLAMESEYDSVVLSSPGSARYLQSTDILVTQNWGNRIVRIDLYDPSGSTDANKVGFTGAITLSYRAITPSDEYSGLNR